MYEYANRLAARGHAVTLLHPVARPYKKASSPIWLKRLLFAMRGVSRPKWFALRKNVASKIIPSAEAAHIPDADVSICTWWEMAYMLDSWPESKGVKFNLIQDYETWSGHEELVKQSYRLPLNHVCISRHLRSLVATESGREPMYLPNAVDMDKFFVTQDPKDRDPQSVIMLYSTEARKGTPYGIEALRLLKNKFPALRATLFGVVESQNLPDWIRFHKRPGNLVELYNRHAVFLTPSIAEGWALPPAEAMSCGCAVVCTDIGGHKDYAIDEKTALLVSPESPEELANAAARIMIDGKFRLKLAENGGNYIREKFDWEKNTDLLLDCIPKVTDRAGIIV